mmetsp:Transcript_9142/g.29012  ORF Transcript_9142/g.29012 Transcript_9142/m.29012 type:complete len:205 (-) Transcript_9142:77-691(-)
MTSQNARAPPSSVAPPNFTPGLASQRTTLKRSPSSGLRRALCRMGTCTVRSASPCPKTTLPSRCSKSRPARAVPSTVLYVQLIWPLVPCVRTMPRVTDSPSCVYASRMSSESVPGMSSFRRVTRVLAVPRRSAGSPGRGPPPSWSAPAGLGRPSLTEKCSSGCQRSSSMIPTEITRSVCPASKRRMPSARQYRTPSRAVPSSVQ